MNYLAVSAGVTMFVLQVLWITFVVLLFTSRATADTLIACGNGFYLAEGSFGLIILGVYRKQRMNSGTGTKSAGQQ